MQGAKGIFASKRATFALFVLICATVLASFKIITGADWLDLAKFVTGFVVAGHTLSGVTDSVVNRTSSAVPTAKVIKDSQP